MSRLAHRFPGLALALLTALAYVGCAASSSNTVSTRRTSSDAGSSDVGGEAGAPSGNGAASGKGGMGTINTGPDAGAGGADDSCAAELTQAQTVPLDMLIMMDTSGSMNDVTETGIVKWTAVKGALETFLQDSDSAGLGVGIQYFPLNKPDIPLSCLGSAECGAASPCLLNICYNLDVITPCITNADCNGGPFYPPADCAPWAKCGTSEFTCRNPGTDSGCIGSDGTDYGVCAIVTDTALLKANGLGICVNSAKCDAASYSVADQPITMLPTGAAAIVSSMEARTPYGNTPTAPALTGAISQATAWAKAHPEHQVITVMVTDGLPTQCGPQDIASISKIASNGLASAPSIETFVIGIFGATDIGAGADSNLDKIASAGGTDSAFILYTSDDVSSQLITALDKIRGTRLSCEYVVPPAKDNQKLDYGQVNMDVTANGKTTSLVYVGSVDNCDPITGGWYYNSDPATTDPTRIEICPVTCTSFQGAVGASLQIAVGCQTIVK